MEFRNLLTKERLGPHYKKSSLKTDIMKKILQLIQTTFTWLCSRPVEKYLHVIAGMFIAALFAITFNVKACIVPAFVAGFLKEFIDLWRNGPFDWKDLLATTIGGLLLQIIVIL